MDERERAQVRRMAERLPAEMRDQRGRMLLETECATLGLEDRPCPACAGTGWLDRAAVERCPVCRGFCEVPEGLARWWRARWAGVRDRMARSDAAPADDAGDAARGRANEDGVRGMWVSGGAVAAGQYGGAQVRLEPEAGAATD